MSKYRKESQPVPVPTPVTQPFWDATREHRLMLQRCANGHTFYYARTHCPECLSNELSWVQASGREALQLHGSPAATIAGVRGGRALHRRRDNARRGATDDEPAGGSRPGQCRN